MGNVIQFPIAKEAKPKPVLTLKFKDLHYDGVDYLLMDVDTLRKTIDSLIDFNCPEAASCFQTMVEYLEGKG